MEIHKIRSKINNQIIYGEIYTTFHNHFIEIEFLSSDKNEWIYSLFNQEVRYQLIYEDQIIMDKELLISSITKCRSDGYNRYNMIQISDPNKSDRINWSDFPI
jgi:hypothetical protein